MIMGEKQNGAETNGHTNGKHYVGTRPVWVTPEGAKAVKELLG